MALFIASTLWAHSPTQAAQGINRLLLAQLENAKRPEDPRTEEQYQADCAAGLSLSSCGPMVKPKDCAIGNHWTKQGLGYFHCVLDDSACPSGTELTHDDIGNASCKAIVCPDGFYLQSDICRPNITTPDVVLISPFYNDHNYVVAPTANGASFNLNIALNYNTGNGTWSVNHRFWPAPAGRWFRPSQEWETVGPVAGNWTSKPSNLYDYRITRVAISNSGSTPVPPMVSSNASTALVDELAQGCRVLPPITSPANAAWPGGWGCFVGVKLGWSAQPSQIYPSTNWTALPANSVVSIASVTIDNALGFFDGIVLNYIFTIEVRDRTNPTVVFTSTIGLGIDEPNNSCNPCWGGN